MPDLDAAQLYVNSMNRIRDRIDLVVKILDRSVSLGSEAFETELVYLQFRKVLEEMAFSSLVANKEQYAAVHANFSIHWKAEGILKVVEGLNPKFYPQALKPPISAHGFHHFDLLASGFLTREDFASLYDVSSQVLHTRNPYSANPVIQAKYSGYEWVSRIQRLLSWHAVNLVNGEVLLVNIPSTGPVHVYPGGVGVDLDPLHAEANRRKAIMYEWLQGKQDFVYPSSFLITNPRISNIKSSSSRQK